MASRAFTAYQDSIGYYAGLPAADDSWRIMLLKSLNIQTDDELVKHLTFASILGNTNREADFANYGTRKAITQITRTVLDDGRIRLTIPDTTWVQAGSSTGGINNTIAKAVIGYAPASNSADTVILPILALELFATTDGNDLTLRNPSGVAIVSNQQAA